MYVAVLLISLVLLLKDNGYLYKLNNVRVVEGVCTAFWFLIEYFWLYACIVYCEKFSVKKLYGLNPEMHVVVFREIMFCTFFKNV